MVLGDETSREMDQKLGYFLHLSFGKVTEMNSTTFRVHLNWLFLERYSSKLRSWRLPTDSLYSTELDSKEILTDISGEPLMAKLDSKNRFTEATLKVIKEEVGLRHFEEHF